MAKKNVLTRAKKQKAMNLMQQGQVAEAMPLLEQICRTDRTDGDALFMLGIANGMTGQHAAAEQAFRQILKLHPGHPDASNNLGLSLDALGRAEEALVYFESAIKHSPENPEFVFNYANALESLGKFKQARTAYQKVIALAPNHAQAWCNLGNVLQAEGDAAQAVAAFEKAIAISAEFVREYPQVYNNLGNVLMDLGRAESALVAYRTYVNIKGSAEAYLSLGNAYLQTGDRENAAAALQEAIKRKPVYGSAYHNLVQTRRFQEGDHDIAEMQALYQRADVDDEDKMYLAFALGKAFADLKQDQVSFEYYRQGNLLKRRSQDYSIAQDRALFSTIRDTFTADFLTRHAGVACDDATPIFIVGMPRSGTTLVEQILASHSQVYGADELNDMRIVVEHACDEHSDVYPLGLLQLSQEEFFRLGFDYVARLHTYAPDAVRITDKMPHNFLYLGLIKMVLPNAKIIHCQRNPMDNALSIYKELFSNRHAYAYDLNELGQYYRLYQELMLHWRRIFPNGFYDLVYEDLVADQENQTRRLLAYCELSWEDSCLAFYRTQRVVRTASLAQVRQPMHAHSVAAWQRFEQELQPFIHALA